MCDIAIVQIILVAPCANRKAIKRMLQVNRMFHMRMAEIVAWARHLAAMYGLCVDDGVFYIIGRVYFANVPLSV